MSEPDKDRSAKLDREEAGSLLISVINEMLEGVQIIDHEWRYLYVNETVARQGRREREELLGRTMMECYPGIEETRLFDELRACKETQKAVRMENHFEYPDGTTGWFELFLQPVKEGVLILSIDITKRKMAEAQLQEKIGEIERLMRLTVKREARMAELKEAIEELKTFAPRKGRVVEGLDPGGSAE